MKKPEDDYEDTDALLKKASPEVILQVREMFDRGDFDRRVVKLIRPMNMTDDEVELECGHLFVRHRLLAKAKAGRPNEHMETCSECLDEWIRKWL